MRAGGLSRSDTDSADSDFATRGIQLPWRLPCVSVRLRLSRVNSP